MEPKEIRLEVIVARQPNGLFVASVDGYDAEFASLKPAGAVMQVITHLATNGDHDGRMLNNMFEEYEEVTNDQ